MFNKFSVTSCGRIMNYTRSCRGGMLSRIFHSFFNKLQGAILTTFRLKIDKKKYLKAKFHFKIFIPDSNLSESKKIINFTKQN